MMQDSVNQHTKRFLQMVAAYAVIIFLEVLCPLGFLPFIIFLVVLASIYAPSIRSYLSSIGHFKEQIKYRRALKRAKDPLAELE
jgi:hypothetical protein